MSRFCQTAEGDAQVIIQHGHGSDILVSSYNGHVRRPCISEHPAVVVSAQGTQQVPLPVVPESVLETEPVGFPDPELLLRLPVVYVKQGEIILLQEPVHLHGRIVSLSFRSRRFFQPYQLTDTVQNLFLYIVLVFHKTFLSFPIRFIWPDRNNLYNLPYVEPF